MADIDTEVEIQKAYEAGVMDDMFVQEKKNFLSYKLFFVAFGIAIVIFLLFCR